MRSAKTGSKMRRSGVVVLAAGCVLGVSGQAYGIRYEVRPIGLLMGAQSGEARSINEQGQAVGMNVTVDGVRAVYWDEMGTVSLLPTPVGTTSSNAYSINEAGQIAGYSEVETIGPPPFFFITIVQSAILYTPGMFTDLNGAAITNPGIDMQIANGINSAGRMVGTGRLTGVPGLKGWDYKDAVVTDLGGNTEPQAVSDSGVIVGVDTSGRAFRMTGAITENLHEYANVNGANSGAFDINSAGLVVGEAQFGPGLAAEACVFDDGVANYLGTFGTRQSRATGVNEIGMVVGYGSGPGDGFLPIYGFLYFDGDFVSLDSLHEDPDWDRINFAYDVNDRGQIVGVGTYQGVYGMPFVMTPIGSDCPADHDGNGMVEVADIFAYLNDWFNEFGTTGIDLLSDSDLNFKTEVADIFVFLGHWFAAFGVGCN